VMWVRQHLKEQSSERLSLGEYIESTDE